MTIASQTSRITYTGDGSTTAFAVPFYFAANGDLVVYLQDTVGNQTLQVLGTNYNLTGATVSSGGTCTFVTAPTTGYLISVYRDPPATQTTSYNNNDPFPAKSHELALDKLTTLAQRVKDIASRSIRQSDGEAVMTTQLAPIATRKNKMLGFGTSGELLYTTGPSFVGGTATGTAMLESRAVAQTTAMEASTNVIRTHGYTVFGDGGAAAYKRVGSSPGVGDFFQSSDGAWWERIGGTDVAAFSTIADATASFIGAQTDYVRTAGSATVGDGAAGLYKRVGSLPASGSFFQSADGTYWALTASSASSTFDTRTAAIAASISADTTFLRTGGYAAVGDGGSARYKRVGSAPSHAGTFQSADGAWWEIFEPVLDPRMLGVIADGVTTNTTTLQDAFDVAGVLGGELRMPAGTINFSNTISITNPVTVTGAGIMLTTLMGTGGVAQGMFQINCDGACQFRNMKIASSVSMTGGYAIQLNSLSGVTQNDFSIFQNLIFSSVFIGIDIQRGSYWLIDAIQFSPTVANGTGIIVRNTTTPDSGDNCIRNCQFLGGPGYTGILWVSSGGTRIHSCKFLQVANGIVFQPTANVQTGIFIVTECSFDGCTGTSISAVTALASETMTDWVIANNVFDGAPANAHIFAQQTAGNLGRMAITGNTMISTAASVPLQIISGGAVLITGNQISCTSANSISIGATVSAGLVTANLVNSHAVSNASGSVTANNNI